MLHESTGHSPLFTSIVTMHLMLRRLAPLQHLLTAGFFGESINQLSYI